MYGGMCTDELARQELFMFARKDGRELGVHVTDVSLIIIQLQTAQMQKQFDAHMYSFRNTRGLRESLNEEYIVEKIPQSKFFPCYFDISIPHHTYKRFYNYTKYIE